MEGDTPELTYSCRPAAISASHLHILILFLHLGSLLRALHHGCICIARTLGCCLISESCFPQAIASVDREEMFVEHMKERDRRKRAEEKAARKRKLQDFRELLERSSGIKVCSRCYHHAV